MEKIYQTEMIEVVVPIGSTASQFMIPDQPNLRNVQLLKVKSFSLDIIPLSPISQTPVIEKASLMNASLTLENYGGYKFLHLAPLSQFQTIENGISGYTYVVGGLTVYSQPTIQEKDFKQFTGQYVNWPKCFITMGAPITAAAFARVFLLQISYNDPAYKEVVPNKLGTRS